MVGDGVSRGGAKNMNTDGWLAVAGALVLAALAWVGARWWYLRKIRALHRQIEQMDGSTQNLNRMMAQARKQIEQLQQIVAEYRRRHAALEVARRGGARVTQAFAQMTEPEPAAAAAANAEPERPVARPPGGWADTQPM